MDNYHVEDAYGAYKRAVEKYPILTDQEVRELLRNPTPENKNKVRKAYMRFVFSVFEKTYYIYDVLQRNDIIEFVNEGMEGMMRAIEEYDPDSKASFRTYARFWIKKRISSYIQTNRLVNLPANIIKLKSKIDKVQTEYRKNYGVDPDISYLAEQLHETPEKIYRTISDSKIYSISCSVVSKPNDDEDEGDFEFTSERNMEEEILSKMEQEDMLMVLTEVAEKKVDQDILDIIVSTDDVVSHKDIADMIGVSRQYVTKRIKVLRENYFDHKSGWKQMHQNGQNDASVHADAGKDRKDAVPDENSS